MEANSQGRRCIRRRVHRRRPSRHASERAHHRPPKALDAWTTRQHRCEGGGEGVSGAGAAVARWWSMRVRLVVIKVRRVDAACHTVACAHTCEAILAQRARQACGHWQIILSWGHPAHLELMRVRVRVRGLNVDRAPRWLEWAPLLCVNELGMGVGAHGRLESQQSPTEKTQPLPDCPTARVPECAFSACFR